MPIRTFIALEPHPEVFEELKGHLLEWKQAHPQGVNWVRPENLHLTLLFLGDTDEVVIPELKEGIRELCRKEAAFELATAGYELFPAKQPRMIWAQLKATDERIFKLNKRLFHLCGELGIEADPKPLRLHITMGRIKQAQSPETERKIMQTALDNTARSFDLLTLYRSDLRPEGPRYSIIEQIRL